MSYLWVLSDSSQPSPLPCAGTSGKIGLQLRWLLFIYISPKEKDQKIVKEKVALSGIFAERLQVNKWEGSTMIWSSSTGSETFAFARLFSNSPMERRPSSVLFWSNSCAYVHEMSPFLMAMLSGKTINKVLFICLSKDINDIMMILYKLLDDH